MSWQSLHSKVLGATVAMTVLAGEAGAFGWLPTRPAPEIDGPAGIAAIALLVSAGLIAYNRFRK